MAMPERLAFPRRIPFADALGFELWRFDGGHAELQLALEPGLHNSFGVAHGGVLMTLLDVTMAMAGRSRTHHADDEQMGLVTIEMKTTFMQPAQGARIASHGRCVYRTRTMAFCEADIVDEGRRPVARASGTFKYVRQR